MKFMTIRQTAATGLLPENRLRLMQKAGTLPGIQSGNRFLINYDALIEQLERESRSKEVIKMGSLRNGTKPVKKIDRVCGERLFQMRQELQITQKELAMQLGTSDSLISFIENGRLSLTGRVAIKIAQLYPRYSAAWLMHLDADTNTEAKAYKVIAEWTGLKASGEIAAASEEDKLEALKGFFRRLFGSTANDKRGRV